MATITAQSIVDKAGVVLQDTTNTRWPESELLGWLNDGQREVVLMKPDAYPQTEDVTLVEGTKQSIPAAGLQLIDVVRNNGTSKRAVRYIDRSILDEQLPSWHSSTADAEVQHFTFDERNPKQFYVYPPQPSSGFGTLEIVYSKAPTNILITDTITIDDVYANALLDYILYRAYSKDADYTANAQRAVNAYNSFQSSLGTSIQVDAAYDPSRKPDNITQTTSR